MAQQEADIKQVLGVLSQRLSNLELTVNALLMVLDEKGSIDKEELNEKAQSIVQQMQQQQQAAQQAAQQAEESEEE